MNAAWKSRAAALGERMLNPIVVKELRQAVRSRFVASVLVFFLVVELFATGIVLATTQAAGVFNVDASLSSGRSMFYPLQIILSGACMLFVPLYAGIRLAMERWDEKLDLFFITTIKPGAIIRGKLAAGMIIAILIFSAAMPFMSFTYLLRGIDLLSVLVVMSMTFLALLMVTQAAIFVACVPASRAFRILMALGAVGGLFGCITTLNAGAFAMVHQGIGSLIATWDFWGPALVTIGICGAVFGLLHVLSIALISPVWANRALPVRLYVTAVWLIFHIVAVCLGLHWSTEVPMMVWYVVSTIVLTLALQVAVSERSLLSARVKKMIPGNPVLRPFAFFFYNGSAGGTLWVVVLMLLTFAGAMFWLPHVTSGSLMWEMDTVAVMAGIFLYAYAYAMTGVLLWRKLFRRRVPPGAIWVLALLIMSLVSILPTLIAAFMGRFMWDRLGLTYLGNMFALGDDEYRAVHLWFAAVWGLVTTAANAGWFLAQIRQFCVPVPEKPVDSD